MIHYVLGYVFDKMADGQLRVLLIKKNRPAWMVDLYNGLGGKIEPGEAPFEAMRREFREEAGVEVPYWQQVVRINSGNAFIHVFTALVPSLASARSVTDEQVWPFFLDSLPRHTIDNVRWMVPMAALCHRNGYSVIGNPLIQTLHPAFDAPAKEAA